MNGRALERAHPRGHEAPDATRPNTPAVHEGRHPRLWVIRCTGPADQRPLPERLPSIPSTESAREQGASNDLFHEPEAQPKCVTAGALSPSHPTWPPAQRERLPLPIQAEQLPLTWDYAVDAVEPR
jgi:hypothetical protein